MRNSIKAEEQIVDLIKKNHHLYEGTFSALVDGVEFMHANTNVLFHKAEKDYFIIGEGQKNKDYVTFCVEQDLENEGPHKVEKYEGGLVWSVKIKDVFHEIRQGQANMTFLQRGEYRYGAFGVIDFVLPDERKITGKFEIKRRE